MVKTELVDDVMSTMFPSEVPKSQKLGIPVKPNNRNYIRFQNITEILKNRIFFSHINLLITNNNSQNYD